MFWKHLYFLNLYNKTPNTGQNKGSDFENFTVLATQTTHTYEVYCSSFGGV